MSVTERAVLEIIPEIYAGAVADLGLPMHADLSRGNQCHILTSALHTHLTSRQMPSRREEHETKHGWHYVIAHTLPGREPSQNDPITDMNPWQHTSLAGHTGPLHLRRYELEAALRQAGAPEWFVGLRGLATITQAHTLRTNPRKPL